MQTPNDCSIFKSKYLLPLCTLTLFILSTLIQFYLSDFPKVFHVFQDELRYLSIGESLAMGRGITIYNQNTDFQKILYSIILMPAFFFTEKAVQIKAICFINALVMSSGIFPVYLLSKKLLTDTKSILLTLVIFVLSSEFCYTLVFMSEVLYMPLGLWAIYLFYQIIACCHTNSKTAFLKYGIGAGVIVYLLYLNKEIALSFLVAYFLYVAYQFISFKVRKETSLSEIKQLIFLLLIAGGVFFILFLSFKLTIFNGYGNSYNQTSLDAVSSLHNILYMFYGFFYYLLCVLIAWFYFPVVFPLTAFKKMDKTKQNFTLFLGLLLFVSAGVIAYTITVREDLDKVVPRIHLRYICFLFMPFFIVFLSSFKKATEQKLLKPQLITAIVLSAIILLFFKGAADSSFVDNSLLKYVPYYLVNETRLKLFKILLVGCILLATALFHSKNRRLLVFTFSAFIFTIGGINVLNYRIAYKNYRISYSISKEEVQELNDLRDFVLRHPDSNFLVVHSAFRQRYQAMLDTYLNCPNVYTTDLPWIIEHQGNTGYNLAEIPLKPVYENGFYEIPIDIDYIISTRSDVQWDLNNPSSINFTGQNGIYALYQLDSSNMLPLCSGMVPDKIGESHTFTESPYFATFYTRDGEGTFVSNETPNYLLYGPYTYVTPGTYSVAFEYEYTGTLPPDTNIGFAEVSASGMDLSQYKVSLTAGETSVSIENIVIPTSSFSFESKLYATVPGIRFKSVSYHKISN